MSYVVPFENLRMTDVDSVGGKNASLGEMISQLSTAGVRVPGGFATTADAFRDFLKVSGLDARIANRLSTLNPEDVRALAEAGAEIRQWIIDEPFSAEFEKILLIPDIIKIKNRISIKAAIKTRSHNILVLFLFAMFILLTFSI